MTDKMTFRTFPTAYKLKAIKRTEEGEGVLPVARKLLHDGIKAWKVDGPAGLNRKRGPQLSIRQRR
jgi:transposase